MTDRIGISLALVLATVLLGCQGDEFYRKQREAVAQKHFEEIIHLNAAENKVYSLNDCIEYALQNNLDLKAVRLKQTVSSADKYSEMLKMLPEANLTLDLNQRSNELASVSIDDVTDEQSLAMSKSSDRNSERFNVDVAFSAIDFGVAYLSSVQAQDRVLLDKQLEYRAAQSLMLDVVKAYFNVAASQDAIAKTSALLKKAGDTDKLLQELLKSRAISPLRVLDERKRFIQLEESLMVFQKNYVDACIELKSLMGTAPGSAIKVDTSMVKSFDQKYVDVPDLYLLEKIALRSRPELYELDMQHHITAIEADKTILTMFPNVKMFLDFTQDSNQYLYNKSWTEIGIRAAYNAARIPSKFMEYKSLVTEQRELDVRTKAMSFGVLAQVRVAYRNIEEAKRRYKLDERVFKSYSEHLNAVRNEYQAKGSATSRLDFDRLEMETVEAEIYRTMAIGNCYLAHYRLFNATGLRAKSFEEANREIAAMETAIASEIQFCQGMNYVRDDGVIVYNGVDFILSAPEGQRKSFDLFAANGYHVAESPAQIIRKAMIQERWTCKTPIEIINQPVTLGASKGTVTKEGKLIYNGVVCDLTPLNKAEMDKLERLDLRR